MPALPWIAKRKRLHILDRNAGLVQIGKLAGAGQHVLTPGDIGLARLARGGDLALDQPLLKRWEHAAGFFDLLKQRPGSLAQLLRQTLDAA